MSIVPNCASTPNASATKMICYAGIGSRETPLAQTLWMSEFARLASQKHWRLHSGGAPGADQAFERGAIQDQEHQRIYLPWSGFEGKRSDPSKGFVVPAKTNPHWLKAMELAEKTHPAWDRLKEGAKQLMARNIYQILGDDLSSPVDFVVMWAPKIQTDWHGCIFNVKGGTGQAVRLAYQHGIEIFCTERSDHRQILRHKLGVGLQDLPEPEDLLIHCEKSQNSPQQLKSQKIKIQESHVNQQSSAPKKEGTGRWKRHIQLKN